MGTKGEEEAVWALSEKDGKTLWSVQLGARPAQRMPQGKDGPGCTPTVDGERLYGLSMAGKLSCAPPAARNEQERNHDRE